MERFTPEERTVLRVWVPVLLRLRGSVDTRAALALLRLSERGERVARRVLGVG